MSLYVHIDDTNLYHAFITLCAKCVYKMREPNIFKSLVCHFHQKVLSLSTEQNATLNVNFWMPVPGQLNKPNYNVQNCY